MADASYGYMTFQRFTIFGGGERVRTDDLLRARQALSQLSYTPDSDCHHIRYGHPSDVGGPR
jgi:hypothetical protein